MVITIQQLFFFICWFYRKIQNYPLSVNFKGSYKPLSVDFTGKYNLLSVHFTRSYKPSYVNFTGSYKPLSVNFTGKYNPLSIHFTWSYKPSYFNFTGSYKPLSVNYTGSYKPSYVNFTGSYKPLSVHFTGSYKPSYVNFTWSYKPLSVNFTGSYKPLFPLQKLQAFICKFYRKLWTFICSFTGSCRPLSVNLQEVTNLYLFLYRKLQAFIWDSSRLEYEAGQNCELITVGDLFGRSGLGVGLQKKSPWTSKISMAILKLHESKHWFVIATNIEWQ